MQDNEYRFKNGDRPMVVRVAARGTRTVARFAFVREDGVECPAGSWTVETLLEGVDDQALWIDFGRLAIEGPAMAEVRRWLRAETAKAIRDQLD